jgi:hypothetical protein
MLIIRVAREAVELKVLAAGEYDSPPSSVPVPP